MKVGGSLRPKFVCGVTTNRSATRLPTCCGEVPTGQFLNSFGCCAVTKVVAAITTIIPRIQHPLFLGTVTPPSFVLDFHRSLGYRSQPRSLFSILRFRSKSNQVAVGIVDSETIA